MSTILSVYLKNEKVGKLELDDSRRFVFTYNKSWRQHDSAIPLSIGLPLQEELYRDDRARPFFSNLLPESEIRQIIARKLGLSVNNDFALLQAIGGECAGAVSLLPEETKPTGEQSYRTLTDERLNEIIEELPKRPLLAGEEGIRLSLAGAQNKLPVLYHNNRISLPVGEAASSHILKPPMARYQHTVENEAFCMQLAQDIGLTVPTIEKLHKKENLYLVERYDRVYAKDSQLERVHQEDFCQALGVAPDQKYEKEGGPGLQQCFTLVREKSVLPTKDVSRLLDWVIFNYLIGNADAHAKNISLLLTQQGPHLAPFYDLMCTQIYEGLTNKLAMKIGGKDDPDWIIARYWQALADDIEINFKLVKNRLLYIRQTVLDIAPKTKKALVDKHGECKVYDEIIKVIESRANKVTTTLFATKGEVENE
ncbi:MAG: type II toxin-antitoxin system HipA family toxin [Arenicellales bacterium]